MSRRQWSLFYGFAILVSFLTVSCSQPGKDLLSAKSSPSATSETLNKSALEPAPAEEPEPARDAKPAEEVKKKRVEPVTPAVTPQPSSRPAPAAAPVAAPQQTVASAPPAPPSIVLPAPQSDPIPVPTPPPPPEPTTKQVTIPAGTEVYIRMIDPIDTERSHPNETFRASLDKPILVDNQTIIPKRSDVYVKVIEVQSAGKLSGTSELKVQLDRIFIGKQSYTVASNTFTQTGASEGKKAARNVGIGAAVGGVLGGILGGTKGAVIGAGAGGGGGAVISKGEQIHIDSERELMFKLENPLDLTIAVAPSASTPRTTSSRFTVDSDGPAKLAPPPERPASRSSSQGSSSNENDLTGNWTVTTDGSQYMTLQLNLRQNGNNLQGSISDPRGSGTIPIRGSVSANYVTFSTQSQYGANNDQMQFSGAIQGDRMQGSVTMPNTSYGNTGAYPGGYPGGYPGNGYPGGGRTRGPRNGSRATIQARWNAQRNN